MSELKCQNCNAEFYIETIEDSEESDTPQFCPFCGSEDIGDVADDEAEDEGSFDTEEEDEYDDEDE